MAGRFAAVLAAYLGFALFGTAASAAAMCDVYPSGRTEFLCDCAATAAAAATDGSEPAAKAIWGEGPYRGDSDLCTAARHAGAVGDAGGRIRAVLRPGRSFYYPTEANGVTPGWWGRWGFSVDVYAADAPRDAIAPSQAGGLPQAICAGLPEAGDPLRCYCPPVKQASGDDVFGSIVYSADSDICNAARHAGMIGLLGGEVSVLTASGLSAYRGTSRNGTTSEPAGAAPRSIVFAPLR